MIARNLPPLDRWLLRIWLVVTASAAIAVFAGGLLILLMFTVIGVPLAMLMNEAPGAWLYLTPTLLLYAPLRLILRRAPPAILLVLAAIPPAVAGVLIPTIANRETDRRVAALIAEDGGTLPTLPTASSVTYLTDMPSDDPKCGDICQRLLFSRTAASYTEGVLSPSGTPAPPLNRYYLGSLDGRCNNGRLYGTYAARQEVGDRRPPPMLWDRLPAFIDDGLCFHADPVRNARSDWVMTQYLFQNVERGDLGRGGDGRFDFSIHPIRPISRREVFRRDGDRMVRVLRRTDVRHARLATPLWLVPPFNFTTSNAGHWRYVGEASAGSRIEIYHPTRWNGFATNDIAVRGIPTR